MTFLQCYFQSEHFPVDLMTASKQCHSENDWEVVIACANNIESFADFANDVRVTQDHRPITELSLRVSLNDQFSHLAAIDLKKALCRVNVRVKHCLALHLFCIKPLSRRLTFGTVNRPFNTKFLPYTYSIHSKQHWTLTPYKRCLIRLLALIYFLIQMNCSSVCR